MNPVPGQPLPQQWSLEDWELGQLLRGGQRNAVTQTVVDGLGLHSIRAWNTSLGLWEVCPSLPWLYSCHVYLPALGITSLSLLQV